MEYRAITLTVALIKRLVCKVYKQKFKIVLIPLSSLVHVSLQEPLVKTRSGILMKCLNSSGYLTTQYVR